MGQPGQRLLPLGQHRRRDVGAGTSGSGSPAILNESGAIANGGDYLPLTAHGASAFTVLTFAEQGLPIQTSWSVAVNGVLAASATCWINFTLANGSYRVPGRHGGGPGRLPIGPGPSRSAARPPPWPFEFAPTPNGPWTVTFVEIGLPAGTLWTVTLGGAGSARLSS